MIDLTCALSNYRPYPKKKLEDRDDTLYYYKVVNQNNGTIIKYLPQWEGPPQNTNE